MQRRLSLDRMSSINAVGYDHIIVKANKDIASDGSVADSLKYWTHSVEAIART